MITVNKDYFINLIEEYKIKQRKVMYKILGGVILGIVLSLLCFALKQSSLGILLTILTIVVSGVLIVGLNKAKDILSIMLQDLNNNIYQKCTYTIIEVVKQRGCFEALYSASGKCSMGDLTFNTGKVEVPLGVCLDSLQGTPIICITLGGRKFHFLGAYYTIEL